MWLTIHFMLLVAIFSYAHGSYVALAPSEFHPGWTYRVQITVSDVPSGQAVNVNGNIFNSQKSSKGASSVSLLNGETKSLDIQVSEDVGPDAYTLQLDGTGGLAFSNSTKITLAPLTHLTFIQTDKKIYKAGQLIRFRVMIVDKDLIPQKMASNITLENPTGSVLAKFQPDGSKAVYENTYQLTDFPELGTWKIKVATKNTDVLEFKVDEYVLPKFEVTADVTPGFLLLGSEQNKVTLGVTAKYTYGKGVRGDVKLRILNVNNRETQVLNDKITDPSGIKNIEIDLSRELAEVGNMWKPTFSVEVNVTDETQRTYGTMTTVRVEKDPVKIEFDNSRTDQVFRLGMPIRALVKLTDPDNKPLDSTFLENDLECSLIDDRGTSPPITQVVQLSPNQMEAQCTFQNIPRAMSFRLQAKLTVNEKPYSAELYLNKYETVGNATLDARWVEDKTMLSVGNMVMFRVDVSDPSHFKSLAYMIVSRGNIQEFGPVTAGQNKNIRVTTDMCPKGRLVVYGITSLSDVSTVPEVIGDSLELKLDHCQDKKVTPSASPTGDVRTGTNVTLSMEVAWTDTSNNNPIGQHDIHMLAVDKSIIMLEGHNDITTDKVEEQLGRFNLQSSSGFEPEPFLQKRSIMPPFPMPGPSPKSTGELFQVVGIKLISDAQMVQIQYPIWEEEVMFFDAPAMAGAAVPEADREMAAGGFSGSVAPQPQVTVRKDFPDTWIWKTVQTDSSGRVSFVEKLPDSITSWVVSGFAVRENSSLGVTAQPLELNAFNPFFVSLNLPYSIRRTEKFELRATVFNYESNDLETSVNLAESNDFGISGESTKGVLVKANSASSVTFMILASKVGVINLKVTATATRANSVQVVDLVERKLIVRPEGVERMRAITFPVFVPQTGEYNKNFTLDFSPWTVDDVVPDSRRAAVKITGDMMGNALQDIDQLVTMPTGCGEQNMITTVPNIYAWAYLESVNDLSLDFKTKASEYMKMGYNKETQQYRWDAPQKDKGGYSAFGRSDQAASTWLTAFVLKSFSQAKKYIPEVVDLDILDSAVEFLFRHQTPDGLFFERGRVIHDDMQGGTGAGDALSVYIVICMLEAKKYGVEIDENKLAATINYITDLSNGDLVKQRQFLAAITAYALALHNPTNANTQATVMRLIQVVDENGGAPWRKQKESTTVKPEGSYYYHPPPGPSDIEVTAYCILAYATIDKVAEGRDLVLWLQRQQNSNGGYRSTQDTVMALQAISQYAAKFASSQGGTPLANVDVTTLDPAGSPTTVTINSDNAKLLQRVELDANTNKVNIRVTGNANSLAVIKVVWNFYTEPETEEKPPSETGTVDPNSRQLKVTTASKMVRPGFHNVTACITPDVNLEYNNMMVMTLDMPSGFQPEDLMETKKQNPGVVRVEQNNEQIHLYMSQPREECMSVMMEQTVMIEDLKPGSANVFAYYQPDIKSEAPIAMAVVAPCKGENCDTGRASSQAPISHLLLAATICLLLSLSLAF